MDIKQKLPIAVEAHTKLDLPFDHATTSMFMLLQPMFYRHTLKTENLHLNFTNVIRPNPLVVPTFGRVRYNLRHFFVPYRLVFPNWDEFSNDVIASNFDNSSQVAGVPFFLGSTLFEMFFSAYAYDLAEVVSSPSEEPRNYDFISGGIAYKLTRLGMSFYKVLYSLGYEIMPKNSLVKFNAFALLAYAKVYCDWYANSSYLNDALYLKLQRYFKFNDPASALELSAEDIYDILLFIRPAVYSSNPYFEEAWDNPVAPNSNQFSGFAFSDPTSDSGTYVQTISNGTPEMFTADGSTSIGTKYIHDALNKLSQYQRRHALSGARAIDRVLAQYGIQSDYLKLQRSIYVGVTQQDVDINSIYATANGSNSEGDSVVGDFAGAGFGAGSSQIQFQNEEEGIFLSIATIQPSGGYFQGYDRNNRHISKQQFFTPEFDALGVQSIEKGEVYVSRDLSTFVGDSDYDSHFGFTGRYGEMKRSINRVSGDFAFPAHIQGGHAWHLMREFNDDYFGGNLSHVVHSQDFARGTDAKQYLRLFTYTDYDIDPFNVFLHVDCVSYAPCRPFMDTFDWDVNSPTISINSNGPKLN